jgi:conjugative transfer region lipoprotein (TIGR03751 family)
MIIIRLVKIIVLISATVAISACTTGVVSPDAGSPTMQQAYHSANSEQNSFNADLTIDNTGDSNSQLPEVSQANKFSQQVILNSQFPTLKNPQSIMYIFGHYAGNEQLPVPGHFTAFSLYTEIHYALPSEAQMPYNDGSTTR